MQINSSQHIIKYITILLCLISLLFLIVNASMNCAHQAPPTGGPEDKTPPVVVNNYPYKESIGIRNLEYIEVEFSESIRQSSISNNYWIIPELTDGFKVKWKGSRKVRFYLNDSLEKDRTYVFTLGTGIKDLRNNSLVSPFIIAFSTGDKLDSCSISGRVFADERISDTYIYAYPLQSSTDYDSLLYQKARYYTQVDLQGNYHLNYLSYGWYRLIALSDMDYNKYYNIETDFIGLTFQDILFDSSNSQFSLLNFYLIKEDTTSPYIKEIDTLSTNSISVQLNEKVQLDTIKIAVWDSISTNAYSAVSVSPNAAEPEKLILYFRHLPPATKLWLRIEHLKDFAGNSYQEDIEKQAFINASQVDTIAPVFLGIDPPPGSNTVPFNAFICLRFNTPIDEEIFRRLFKLKDAEEKIVEGHFDFDNLKEPIFLPVDPLKPNTTYSTNFPLSDLRDLFGNSFPDTMLSLSFTTLDMADLGEIAGRIYVADTSWQWVMVEARSVQEKTYYQGISRVGEEYQIDYLPGGLYLLRSIIDINENDLWDKGKTNPWHFAEPFIFMADTINVRKRWTTQGIDFHFRFREYE
jgi:hypothetical protein